jgi:geranylgeranyl reductase family protein
MQALPFDLSSVLKSRCSRAELRHGKRRFQLDASTDSMWMVHRREFDQFLAEQAAAAGADFRQEEPVVAMEQSGSVCLRTPRETYQAEVVVAADGANGFVSKQAGLRPKDFSPYGIAIEAEVRVAHDRLHDVAVFDLDYAGGYGWVFPKGEIYNLGVGAVWPRRFPEIRQDFAKFLKSLDYPLVGEIHTEARKIPIGGWNGPLVSGRVLAAGDAGGLADPFLGEGIAYALRSGRIAAEESVAFLKGLRADLTRYQSRVLRAMGPDLRLLRQIARLFYTYPGICAALLAYVWPLQRLFIAYVGGRISLGRETRPSFVIP